MLALQLDTTVERAYKATFCIKMGVSERGPHIGRSMKNPDLPWARGQRAEGRGQSLIDFFGNAGPTQSPNSRRVCLYLGQD